LQILFVNWISIANIVVNWISIANIVVNWISIANIVVNWISIANIVVNWISITNIVVNWISIANIVVNWISIANIVLNWISITNIVVNWISIANIVVNWISIANIVVNSPRTRYFPSITIRKQFIIAIRNASNTLAALFPFLDFLTLEDFTNSLTRNFGKELPLKLHSVPEERRSYFRHVHILAKRLLKPLYPSVHHSLCTNKNNLEIH